MKRIAIIAAALLSAPVLQAQGILPAGETFLEPLIQRDSALVADPFAYGFILKDVPRGASFALPDLSKGIGEGLETSGAWQVDSLLTKKQRKALAKGEAVPVDIRISTVVIPWAAPWSPPPSSWPATTSTRPSSATCASATTC